MHGHFQEGNDHRENHPDIDHLDIGCGGQALRYPNEAG